MACPTTIVEIKEEMDELVIRLKGGLGFEAAVMLGSIPDRWIRPNRQRKVTLDVSSVENLDERGVAAVRALRTAVREEQTEFELRGAGLVMSQLSARLTD